MTVLLVPLCAICLIAATVLAALLAQRDATLARIARALEERDPGSNARITLTQTSRGLVAIARAVNHELDAEAERRGAAERAERAMHADLASLSHDIRTPLAGAKGYLQLAMREQDEDARTRYLEAATRRLDAMGGLVDGLLDYAKANDESSPLERERVNVASALSDALMGLYPRFAERGWSPEVEIVDEDLAIMADRGALERVISNLLTNVLRHGSHAPRARATADKGAVRISIANEVVDPGSIDATRLFERFYKADGSRSADGSGLGLAIVARLCERMGGTAQAQIKGSTLEISVTLPRA